MRGGGSTVDPTTEAWSRFLRFAARARANPKFDVEQRAHRLEIAQRIGGMLEATRDGSLSLGPGIETVFRGTFGNRPFSLTVVEQNEWLKGWAAVDEASLAEALIGFLDEDLDANGKFATFASSVERAAAAGKVELRGKIVLAFGSLFNFSIDPQSLPVIRVTLFRRLANGLGLDRAQNVSLATQYANDLEFAQRLQAAMTHHGIPLRDMIDAHSLIWLAGERPEAWVDESAPELQSVNRSTPASRPPGARKACLSVCAIYRNEASYLREWLEFHRLVGVEKFYLYDNRSTDDHRKVLAPYVEHEIVTMHDWPKAPAGQYSAYNHCLKKHGEHSRWLAFIDVDEFLFSPTHRPVSEVLADLDPWPAVGVNSVLFGTSGHRTKPTGLLIENYVQANLNSNTFIKSIVQPERTSQCESAHHFSYVDGIAVDENGYPIHGFATDTISFSRLRINHYWAKSEEEYYAKFSRPEAATGTFRTWTSLRLVDQNFRETDETILHYAPALREAMASGVLQQTRAQTDLPP